MMKIEVLLILLDLRWIDDSKTRFKFLKNFVVDLMDLDWNNIILLLENIDSHHMVDALKLCIVQMNNLYQDTEKYITFEQLKIIQKKVPLSKELETHELLKPFININVQKLLKFIKFIPFDIQKIEYAKISFDKIKSLPNADLYSILESMQVDIFKVKFVELFVDKIEISFDNLVKLIPTEKSSIINLFNSKNLQITTAHLMNYQMHTLFPPSYRKRMSASLPSNPTIMSASLPSNPTIMSASLPSNPMIYTILSSNPKIMSTSLPFLN